MASAPTQLITEYFHPKSNGTFELMNALTHKKTETPYFELQCSFFFAYARLKKITALLSQMYKSQLITKEKSTIEKVQRKK